MRLSSREKAKGDSIFIDKWRGSTTSAKENSWTVL